jgi:hypothetical protein
MRPRRILDFVIGVRDEAAGEWPLVGRQKIAAPCATT